MGHDGRSTRPGGERIFTELLTEHRARLKKERERAVYAFEARGKAIGRIGLPAVREHRRKRLQQEHDARMAARVLQSQESWQALTRDETAKRVLKLQAVVIDDDELTAWLIEAAVRYAGKPVSVPSLQSLPVLFPFNLTRPLAYMVLNNPNLILRSDGPSNQFVALRNTI